jgi:magnesium transporter
MTRDSVEAPHSPSPNPGNPLVRTMACLGGVSLERGVADEDLVEYLRDAENVIWMDVQDPGPEEFSRLIEEFGFHPLSLEDISRGHQRPKVDDYKSYLFVVSYSVLASKRLGDLQTVEIYLFIGRNFLVSVHRGRAPALEEAAAKWTRGGALLREGIGFLAYTVLDAIIDSYFPVLDAIESETEETELEIFTDGGQEEVQRMLRLKRTLIALRRLVYPMRETFTIFLRHGHPFFGASTRVYFQDVYDHVLRILDVLDVEREMVAGAMEASLTVMSNRLNVTMKTLTVITICVAILGSIFGAWGMNFDYIPLQKSPFGFAVVLGFTSVAVIGGALVWWRMRKSKKGRRT